MIERFQFTQEQAEAIVVMRLYRLTNTDVKELKSEYKILKEEIKQLEAIVSNKDVLDALLIKELEEVNQEFVTPRLSTVVDQVEEIVIDEKR